MLQEFSLSDIDYSKYTNRQLVSIPLGALLIAILILVASFMMTGSPVPLGMDFTGGTEIHVSGGSMGTVTDAFTVDPVSVQTVASDNSYILTFHSDSIETLDVRTQAENAGLTINSLSAVSPTFGKTTQELALYGITAAFVLMSLLVALLFRTFIPSVAVVLSAFSDVIIPLAIMNIFGINLSLGTVAALLMLIGYSVDSDLLLNTHVLRRRGDFEESVLRAMDTGVTMTITSMSAMAVMAIAASVFGVQLLASIGLILFIGLSVDLLNTYMLNVSLLRWYTQGGTQ